MKPRASRPLAQLLFRNLAGLSVLVALALAGVQVVWKYGDEKARVMKSLVSLSETFAPGLTSALWVLEDELLKSFTDGLKNDPSVALAQLTDPSGNIVFQWLAGPHRPPSANLTVQRELFWKQPSGEPRLLGRLLLASSSADVENRVREDVGQTILILLVLMLAVVCLLWLFLRVQVVEPLRSFQVQVDELIQVPSEVRIVLGGQRIAEIESLQKDFNSLLEELLSRQAEIKRDNALLEERVLERTKALEQAKSIAEDAARAKGQFLANMSHEIRTPMNAILGFTHLVETTQLTATQSDYIGKIHQSADSLLRIINDILDFSKIDAGKLELSEADFALHSQVTACLDLVRLDAEQKGLGLNWKIDDRLPRYLRGDALRLGQVLTNLVTNAVKFTGTGSITLSVEQTVRSVRGVVCRFSVTDTGIGMSEDQQSRIFQPFSQGDESITRRYGGTGLGLVISRRLVELMGGNLDVRSVPGRGSEFWFTAAFKLGEAPRSAQGTPQNAIDARLRGARILLVEDNPLNQLLARELLRKQGFEVTVADDGKIAVAKVLTESFDLVFMDQQMPVMDGLEATRAIRSRPELADLPIVAMTANAMPESRELCLSAGMNDFLTKPLILSDLNRVLNRWVKVSDRAGALGTTPVISQTAVTPETMVYPEVNLPELMERLMEDKELFREVATSYLDESGGAGAVDHAWQSGDIELARQASHALKGVAANLSLTEVYPASVALESALKESRLEVVPLLLSRLTAAEARAKARLESLV